jgi:hypothetical protein
MSPSVGTGPDQYLLASGRIFVDEKALGLLPHLEPKAHKIAFCTVNLPASTWVSWRTLPVSRSESRTRQGCSLLGMTTRQPSLKSKRRPLGPRCVANSAGSRWAAGRAQLQAVGRSGGGSAAGSVAGCGATLAGAASTADTFVDISSAEAGRSRVFIDGCRASDKKLAGVVTNARLPSKNRDLLRGHARRRWFAGICHCYRTRDRTGSTRCEPCL